MNFNPEMSEEKLKLSGFMFKKKKSTKDVKTDHVDKFCKRFCQKEEQENKVIAGVGGYNEGKGYFPKTESISSCSHVDGNDPLPH